MYHPDDVTYFAETDFRNAKRPFGIKQKDRSKHIYIIGKTGMGKSTLIENMAVQDLQAGRGVAIIDPHGGTAEKLLDYVPERRIDDVLYFAPFDLDYPVSFNVMEDVGPERRHLVANGLMSAFKKIWVDAWSARMEYILNNTLLALLEYPDATILGVNRMLADKTYRKRVVANISDVAVKAFWEQEFAKYSDRYMQEAGAAIQNKIGQFISNPLIRNIIGQPHSSFDLRKIMDSEKILIINLSKGKMGEDNMKLLGSMLITRIYLSAMSRADVNAYDLEKLPNFYFYVDEFQNFATESFADILSESRKYKLNLTIAHQYIEQMTPEVRAAVFGNVGTMITFRVGANDAVVLEPEFAPVIQAQDIVNLGFAQIYLRLMIDGVGSKPFSATTLPPITHPPQSFADLIIRRSREQFALPRDTVEEQLIIWHESHAGLIDDPQVIKRLEKEKNTEPEEPKQREGKDTNVQKSQEKKKSDNRSKEKDRNTRLQKAISLSQLQPQEAESPAEKKPPKQNNNELRQALADVLKEAGLSPDTKKEVKDIPKENLPDKNEKEAKEVEVPRNKVSAKQKLSDQKTDDSVNKDESKQETKKEPTTETKKKVEEPKQVFEIPEDELKKILQVE